MIGLTTRHVRARRAALADFLRLTRHPTVLAASDEADSGASVALGLPDLRLDQPAKRTLTNHADARDASWVALSTTGRSRHPRSPSQIRVRCVAHRALRIVPGRSLHAAARARPLAPESTNTAAASIASRTRGAGGLSHGNGYGTQQLRISRWSALPGFLLNTTALEPVWGSSPGPANRQDFNAVTVLMRTARRLLSGVGVNLGTGRPPMGTLANAAPVNPGAFAVGARIVSANNAAFQSAFPRGNGHTARCGVGESSSLGETEGLHERAGATPIDGAVRAATGRCASPSGAIA